MSSGSAKDTPSRTTPTTESHLTVYVVFRDVPHEFGEVYAVCLTRALAEKAHEECRLDSANYLLVLCKELIERHGRPPQSVLDHWFKEAKERYRDDGGEYKILEFPLEGSGKILTLIDRLQEAARHGEYPQLDPQCCGEATNFLYDSGFDYRR